jgi:hypothetical protein
MNSKIRFPRVGGAVFGAKAVAVNFGPWDWLRLGSFGRERAALSAENERLKAEISLLLGQANDVLGSGEAQTSSNLKRLITATMGGLPTCSRTAAPRVMQKEGSQVGAAATIQRDDDVSRWLRLTRRLRMARPGQQILFTCPERNSKPSFKSFPANDRAVLCIKYFWKDLHAGPAGQVGRL